MNGRAIRLLISSLATGAALAMLTATAGAAAVEDASCPPLGGGNYVQNGDQRFAQTFTAGVTGLLTEAEVHLTKNGADGPGDYTLRIHTLDALGVPTQTVVGSGGIPEAQVPDGSVNLPVTGSFFDPARVVAGESYALVVSRPGAGGNGVRIRGRGAPPGCPGSHFRSISQVAPFTDQSVDLVFTTFVDPPPGTRIRRHPRKRTERPRARFTFTSADAGSTFQCKLDRRPFKPCASPKVYRGLKARRHRFKVRAVDDLGQTDSTPAVFSWRVRGTR